MDCILCSTPTLLFSKVKEKRYYQCPHCLSVMLDPKNYVTPAEERERYLEHNNDVNDPGYQQFVSPIVNAVLTNHSATDRGLDYGSGTGPVATKLLKDQDYNIITYDPIFDRKKKVLEANYDYIICSEVIEHFHNPVEEFQGLRRILKPGGMLYCMTYLYDESIDFNNWKYKDDQTHIIFYHSKAIEWITKSFGYTKSWINNRLITFMG